MTRDRNGDISIGRNYRLGSRVECFGAGYVLAFLALVFFASDIRPAGANEETEQTGFALSYYMSGDGRVGFVLDRTGARPMIQFNGSGEVIPLNVVPATRGDVILRDETGRVMIRVTSYGPATLFSKNDRRGIPLLRARHGMPLATGRRTPGPRAMRRQTKLLAQRVSMMMGKPIRFEAQWEKVGDDDQRFLALRNVVMNVAEALRDIAAKPDERANLVDTLGRVRFQQSGMVGLSHERGTLFVDCDLAKGPDGQPTKESIKAFLREDK